MPFNHRLIRPVRSTSAVLLLMMLLPRIVSAQLRPLDPTDFRTLHGDRVRVHLGGGVYFDQRAALAGTQGRLLEVGDVRFSWRAGRIVVEVAGTVQRFFKEESVLQPPAEHVHPSTPDGKRHDAGDYRVQTIVRLTGDTTGAMSIIRFGSRLPTTDNRVGLDRDQTDFFAILGGIAALGGVHFTAEAGVSINGTRVAHYEQSDVLTYAATIEKRGSSISPFLSVVGQEDFHGVAPRGNEDLGEVRAGLRIGKRRWINVTVLRGFRDFSPTAGLAVRAGASFR